MTLTRSALLLLAALLLVGPTECRPYSSVIAPSSSDPLMGHWDEPLHRSAPVSQAVARQRVEGVFKTFRWQLNSQRPYQEVEIPFTLRRNRPYVQVKWSGRKIDCLVDTGGYFISWPQWLQLDTKQLGVPWRSAGPVGPPVPGELVVSPRIEIGNLTLINITSHPSPPVVQNVPATLFGKPFTFPKLYVVEQAGTVDVLLGADFFYSYRVTIDPVRKVVLLERNP